MIAPMIAEISAASPTGSSIPLLPGYSYLLLSFAQGARAHPPLTCALAQGAGYLDPYGSHYFPSFPGDSGLPGFFFLFANAHPFEGLSHPFPGVTPLFLPLPGDLPEVPPVGNTPFCPSTGSLSRLLFFLFFFMSGTHLSSGNAANLRSTPWLSSLHPSGYGF